MDLYFKFESTPPLK